MFLGVLVIIIVGAFVGGILGMRPIEESATPGAVTGAKGAVAGAINFGFLLAIPAALIGGALGFYFGREK
jgi:hypothetical protein